MDKPGSPLLDAYTDAEPIYIAVDCIVFGYQKGKLYVLLIERDVINQVPHYGLLYGMVKKDKSIDETARQAILHHSGLQDIFLEQLKSFGEVDRDPFRRTVSTCYYALTRFSDCDQEILKANKAKWFMVKKMPKLLFDHQKMIDMALQELKIRVQYKPIGEKLLNKRFTMTELRQLYEIILGRKIDRRNFSRKLFSLNLLERMDEKDHSNSKRGAYYHTFNKVIYKELLEKGLKLEM